MPTLYLRVSPENMPYLDQLAEAGGFSKSQAADLIITTARERGWTVTPGAPRISEATGPGREAHQAAGTSHSSTPEG